MSNESSKIGAAILGMFAAIKICRAEGYEPADVLRLVEQQTEAWGLLPEKINGKEQDTNR
jgi:hypothetical protein